MERTVRNYLFERSTRWPRQPFEAALRYLKNEGRLRHRDAGCSGHRSYRRQLFADTVHLEGANADVLCEADVCAATYLKR